jgi:hypothetical protein
MPKYSGPSRTAMRQAPTRAKSAKPVAVPKGGKGGKESLSAFKSRVNKMSREELLKEAEDILGDETI